MTPHVPIIEVDDIKDEQSVRIKSREEDKKRTSAQEEDASQRRL
jgi:hypothetical protein